MGDLLISKIRLYNLVSILALCLMLVSAAGAVVVSPTTSPEALVSALLRGNPGIAIRSYDLEYCAGEVAVSCGTYTNASGVFGTGPGILLSTGDAAMYYDTSDLDLSYSYGLFASELNNALLAPITGRNVHRDSTRLDIMFDLLPGYDGISIDTVFGSEEFPTWRNTDYNDALGIYVNDENIASVDGLLLNINNRYIDSPSVIEGMGPTGLDGVLAPGYIPLLSFSKFLGDGAQSNRLTIVIGDASDPLFDTLAFVSNLRAHRAVPEPAGILSLGLMSGYAVLAALRRRSK